MNFKKDIIYSENSFFGIPTYYDKKNDIYFCEPESKEFVGKFYEKKYWDNFGSKRNEEKLNFLSKISNLIMDLVNTPDIWNNKNYKILKEKNIINKKIKILEIGSGEGRNLITLKRKGYNIKGIEIDGENVNNINSILGENIAIKGNYEEINYDEKFDLIYLRHVLEHFFDINYVIGKLKNNLNKGGIIFVDVPFSDDKNTLDRSIYEHPHIYHFTNKSLQNIFLENEFEQIHLFHHQRKDFNFSNYKKINSLITFIMRIFKLSPIEKKINTNNKSPIDLIGIFKKL
ncbi:MAG: class I SAM-dependent methyltransferase [Candidatus Gracilibacteria bacterium]|nr:class I SAM-dependent methyltransferase [Candidatus Gracilibacteria bacterium]